MYFSHVVIAEKIMNVIYGVVEIIIFFMPIMLSCAILLFLAPDLDF